MAVKKWSCAIVHGNSYTSQFIIHQHEHPTSTMLGVVGQQSCAPLLFLCPFAYLSTPGISHTWMLGQCTIVQSRPSLLWIVIKMVHCINLYSFKTFWDNLSLTCSMLISVDSIKTIFCLDLDPLSKERLLFLTFSTSAKNRISSSLASPSLARAPIWTPRPSEEISVKEIK